MSPTGLQKAGGDSGAQIETFVYSCPAPDSPLPSPVRRTGPEGE